MAQSSLEIGVEQVRLAKAAAEDDRARQATERQQQRDTLLTALRLEVDAIKKSMELDLRLFNPTTGMRGTQRVSDHRWCHRSIGRGASSAAPPCRSNKSPASDQLGPLWIV